MNVVYQPDIESELRAHCLEHADRGGEVTSRIKDRRRRHSIRPQRLYSSGGLCAAHTIPGPSGYGQLNPHPLVALIDIGLHLIVQRTLRQCSGVTIEWHRRTHFSPEQLVDRCTEALAQNIP